MKEHHTLLGLRLAAARRQGADERRAQQIVWYWGTALGCCASRGVCYYLVPEWTVPTSGRSNFIRTTVVLTLFFSERRFSSAASIAGFLFSHFGLVLNRMVPLSVPSPTFSWHASRYDDGFFFSFFCSVSFRSSRCSPPSSTCPIRMKLCDSLLRIQRVDVHCCALLYRDVQVRDGNLMCIAVLRLPLRRKFHIGRRRRMRPPCPRLCKGQPPGLLPA